MALLTFQSLDFWEEQENVRVNLSRRFYLELGRQELERIAPCTVRQKSLEFDCSQERAERRFNALLAAKMPQLRSILTKNPAVYIHRNSGIPLTGSLSFGLIHRGTSIIEVKPQTTCNLDCVYCSVNEGLSSNQTDYLVERDYLLEEFRKLADFLGVPVEAHIGVQGEPLFYHEFVELVADLSAMEQVYQISTDTNGTLLSKPLLDQLARYPKLRLNISLNALGQEIASKMAGAPYNVPHVVSMIRYAAEKGVDFLIAPLYVPGYNDRELPKLAEFAKTLPQRNHPMLCIQNFMNYTTGRNPVKALGWDAFREKLRALEKEVGMRLLLDFKKDFKVAETTQLPKPFRKGDTVQAVIVAPGRYPKTRLAVAQERVITVFGSEAQIGKGVRLRLLRSKHNIFFAKEV